MAAIIFDLDGTIADSFDYIVNFLSVEANQDPQTPEQMQRLRGMSMIAMAKRFGFSWLRLPRLFYQGRRAMRTSMHLIQPFEGVPEVIEKLHAEGHELFVVSSNSVRNVRNFLHQHQLHTYFLELYGGIGMFSKAPTLRKLVKEHSLDMDNCIYIGDELRDVEAAQAVGMRVVAVGWGFARTDALKALKPTMLVANPHELLQAVEEM